MDKWSWLWLVPVGLILSYLVARAAGAGWFGAKFHYQRKFLNKVAGGEETNGK